MCYKIDKLTKLLAQKYDITASTGIAVQALLL